MFWPEPENGLVKSQQDEQHGVKKVQQRKHLDKDFKDLTLGYLFKHAEINIAVNDDGEDVEVGGWFKKNAPFKKLARASMSRRQYKKDASSQGWYMKDEASKQNVPFKTLAITSM